MRYIEFGSNGTKVSEVVLGMMRIRESSPEEVADLISCGLDCGINAVDTAPIYGPSEGRLGEAFAARPGLRDRVWLQTKLGIRPHPRMEANYFDFSYEHIMESVHGSLAALGTDYLDILLLHRPDALVEPEEVARAFDELQAAGKVRAFGVSNHTPGQIELLRRYVAQPLVVNQLQLSITHAPLIAQGVAANMQALDQSIDRDRGTLEYCRLNDITVQAWSPFQAGFFDGPFLGSGRYPELNAAIDRLSAKYGVEPEALAVAWITRHPARMQVVLGTTTPHRVAAAAAGSELPLTRAEWYELFRAAGYRVP